MGHFIVKTVISALIISLVSELSKRSSLVGAIFASVPLVSVLAIIWLYEDTNNSQAIIELSQNIFWLVLPSLSFFLVLPLLLKQQLNFYWALLIALSIMIVCYFIMLMVLEKFGIKL